MRNYPYLWFRNIIRLLEKRPYSVFTILLFALFVGAFRMFSEWALGGFYPGNLLPSFLTVAGFYWLSFFVFALILRVLVDQPWRVSINVILVGVFLGVFPPIIDTLVSGTGFDYAYIWHFPQDWKLAIYNPEHHITFGEAAVLWAVILLTVSYVQYKQRSLVRTFLAFVLGYATVVFIAAGPATVSELIRANRGWPMDHRVVLQILMQFSAAVCLYLILQPRLILGFVRHIHHALPHVLLCLLGALLVGAVGDAALIYAGLLLIVLFGAFTLQPTAYADAEDARFFTITQGLILAALAAAHSTALFPMLLVFVAMHVLPAGVTGIGHILGRHGAMGLGSILLGVIAGMEFGGFEAPRWWISLVPRPLHPEALQPMEPVTLLVILLVVAGFALPRVLPALRMEDGDSTPAWMGQGIVLLLAAVWAGAPLLLALLGRVEWMYFFSALLAGILVAVVLLQVRTLADRKLMHRVVGIAPPVYILYLSLALWFSHP